MNVYRDSYLEKPKTVKYYSELPDMLDVEVGTTGYKGGDAGNGGSTYFRIENGGSSEMYVDINEDKNGFEVALGGDWELRTIIEALEYSTAVLKFQLTLESVKSRLDEINLEKRSCEVKEQLNNIISDLSHLKESIIFADSDYSDDEDISLNTVENENDNKTLEWQFFCKDAK